MQHYYNKLLLLLLKLLKLLLFQLLKCTRVNAQQIINYHLTIIYIYLKLLLIIL